MGKWPHLTCLGRTTQKSCSWEATAAALQNFLPWDMFMSQKHKITGDSNCICIDPDGISQPLHTLGFLMENYWETSMKWNKFCSTVIFQKRKMDCNTVGKKIWRRKWNRPKDVIFFLYFRPKLYHSVWQLYSNKTKIFLFNPHTLTDLRPSLPTKNQKKSENLQSQNASRGHTVI